jgi:hypothetical protein
VFCVAAISAGLLIGTCGKKNPGSPDDGDTGPTAETYSYTSTDSTIRVSIPLHVDTAKYCIDSTLVEEIDTVLATFLAFSYRIAGATLTLIQGIDTAVYDRVGGGSGLSGTWTRYFTDNNLPSQISFDTGTKTVTLVYQKCSADDFISEWAAYSAYYAVTLQRVSCTQVQLTGDSTGEVVTITWNGSCDMTTASSNPAHAAHTWHQNPLSCPNEDYPDWYYNEFLNDNFIQAPASKRAVRSTALPVKRRRLFQ